MRIGKRKLIGAAGLLGVAGVGWGAWWLWGTDGLVFVTLAVLVLATLVLGWLVMDAQRQIRELLASTQTSLVSAVGEAAGHEQLLRAVQAGFLRADHTLETLAAEWQEQREEMRVAERSLDETVARLETAIANLARPTQGRA